MKKQIALALLSYCFISMSYVGKVYACKCGDPNATGFLPKAAKELIKLPANAKGVLYLVDGESKRHVGSEHFEIRQLDSEAKIELNLVALKHPEDLHEDSQWRLRLFRIEPKNGFLPGKRYLFRSKIEPLPRYGFQPAKQEILVEIGLEVLDPEVLSSVFIQTLGEVESSRISVPASGGMCSEKVFAATQKLQYSIPKELEQYADFLLHFTMIKLRIASPQGDDSFYLWSYTSSICDSEEMGKSNVGNLKELIVSADSNSQKYWTDPPEFHGEIGFFEIADKVYKTKPIAVNIAKPSVVGR